MSSMYLVRMMLIVACGALGAVAGCASSRQASPMAAGNGKTEPAVRMAAHAECLVCKKNADMACVDVDIDLKTPFTEYNGKRYYFCSDECRSEFQKNPAKFATAK